jgi:Effector protein
LVTQQYCRSIRVIGFKGNKLGMGAVMDDKEGRKFVEFVIETLDKVKKNTTGRLVIDSLNTSAKTVTVLCNPDPPTRLVTQTLLDPDNSEEMWKASVVHFRPRQDHYPIPHRDPTFLNDKKDELSNLGLPTTMQQAAPELVRILKRAKMKYSDPVRFIAQIIGKSREEFARMALGRAPIDDDTYFKICVHFYEFLTPGPGASSQVRMQWQSKFAGVREKDKRYNPKKHWDDVPPYIILGHELIHAYHMASGRRIVNMGWEEEAMTVGIGPFTGWTLTENQMRSHAGLPARTTYVDASHTSSQLAYLTKQSNERGGSMAMHAGSFK